MFFNLLNNKRSPMIVIVVGGTLLQRAKIIGVKVAIIGAQKRAAFIGTTGSMVVRVAVVGRIGRETAEAVRPNPVIKGVLNSAVSTLRTAEVPVVKVICRGQGQGHPTKGQRGRDARIHP